MKRTALLFILALLCACQPTPEQEIVVNQGDRKLEQLVTETLAPEETPAPVLQYETPERITETYPLGIGTAQVVFDAPVTVPFGDRYTVYEVKKATPTMEQALRMLSAFFGSATLYQGQFQATKAYYAEMLKYCDESEAVQKRNREMADSGFGYTMQYFIKDNMDSAPLDAEEVPADLDALAFPIYLHGWLSDTGIPYNVSFHNQSDLCEFIIAPEDLYIADETLIEGGEYPGAPKGRKLDQVSIEREDAIAIADDFLARAGIPYMGLSQSESVRAEYTNSLTGEHHSQGWWLTYHHTYNGITGVNQKYSGTMSVELYQSAWPQETIYLYVDSAGIQWVRWFGMSEVVEQQEKALEIAPFDAVLTSIKGRLKAENAYAEIDGTRTVRVTNIELGYCVIQKAGDATRGYTVPAWIISYIVENENQGGIQKYYYDFVLDAVTRAQIHTTTLPNY